MLLDTSPIWWGSRSPTQPPTIQSSKVALVGLPDVGKTAFGTRHLGAEVADEETVPGLRHFSLVFRSNRGGKILFELVESNQHAVSPIMWMQNHQPAFLTFLLVVSLFVLLFRETVIPATFHRRPF
jgi:hypothetical protein